MSWMNAVRPSRRPLRGLLRMRTFLDAITRFLMLRSAQRARLVLPQPISAQDPAMQHGQVIYNNQCAACHTAGGEGIVGLFPRLSGGRWCNSHK
jgi:mono/diheme cytochrome c family protein